MVGPRPWDIEKALILRYEHWCGRQGYGMNVNDVCPACRAARLRTEGMSEEKIAKEITDAIANVRP